MKISLERVCDRYRHDIDLEVLAEKSDENDYWNSVWEFVEKIWDSPVEMLTESQINWLDRIVRDSE